MIRSNSSKVYNNNKPVTPGAKVREGTIKKKKLDLNEIVVKPPAGANSPFTFDFTRITS